MLLEEFAFFASFANIMNNDKIITVHSFFLCVIFAVLGLLVFFETDDIKDKLAL